MEWCDSNSDSELRQQQQVAWPQKKVVDGVHKKWQNEWLIIITARALEWLWFAPYSNGSALDIKDEGQNPQHSNCSVPTKRRRQSKKPLSINLSYDVRRPLYYEYKAGCLKVLSRLVFS